MFVVTCVSSAFLLLIPCVGAQLQARLVNGTAPWNGRLEILNNGTWGTVCSYGFGKEEAIVACRMLGFNMSQALAVSSLFYGKGSGPVVVEDVLCTGEESSLEQCKQRGLYKHMRSYFDDVGVVCYTQPVRLRLTDTHGIRHDRGRVEMEVGGQWITLCMHFYYSFTAPVVCRQLGFSYSALFRNASIPGKRLFGLTFDCLGYETNLFDCEQRARYRFCLEDYSILCGDSPFLRILYDKHLYPPLEGTNLTLECESPQSGQSNVTYRWYADTLYSKKYLTFDKVTRQHQGLKVRCWADYVYDGLTYWVVSDVLVLNVCCAPTINSTNRPPPALSSIGDEGHLSIEMTAHPTPHLIKITYLGPVLNKSIKGKNIGNITHVDCVTNLQSRALVTCSLTVFNFSQAAQGFYKIVFSNSLGNLPFLFMINRNVDHTRELSTPYFLAVDGSFTGGVIFLTTAAISLLCRWRHDIELRNSPTTN